MAQAVAEVKYLASSVPYFQLDTILATFFIIELKNKLRIMPDLKQKINIHNMN